MDRLIWQSSFWKDKISNIAVIIRLSIIESIPMVLSPLGRLLSNIACGVAGQSDAYDGSAVRRIGPGGIGYIDQPFGEGGDWLARRACQLGDPPLSPTPVITPYIGTPFREGGYCLTSYSMVVSWTYKLYPSGIPTDNPPSGSATIVIVGPVQGLFTDDYPSPNLYAINGVGNRILVASIFNDTLDFGPITNITFTRLDGEPDNCAPPPFTPVAPPISVPNPDNPTGPNIVVIPFTPIFAPNGTVNIPFTVDVGEGAIQIEINLNEGEETSSPVGGSPQTCAGPNVQGPDGTEPTEDEPPPEEEYLVGIHVRCTISNTETPTEILPQGDGPSIFVPRLGDVSFLVRAGSLQSWLADVPIKHKSQWIPCPGPFYATDWAIIPRRGVVVKAYPVYVTAPVVAVAP